jgi:hypothetical protein
MLDVRWCVDWLNTIGGSDYSLDHLAYQEDHEGLIGRILMALSCENKSNQLTFFYLVVDLMVCHKRNTELMTLPLSPLTFRH